MNPFLHGWRNPAVMFGGGGGGSASQPVGTSVTTQSSEPWSGQKPYLEGVFNSANYLYNNAPETFYPEQDLRSAKRPDL